jgi:hypothetical protein
MCFGVEWLARKEQSMAKSKSLVFLSVYLVLAALAAAPALALSFTDVTKESGADDKGRGKGVAFADIDGDGDHDLYVSNKCGANKLYRNDSLPEHPSPTSRQRHHDKPATRLRDGVAFADVDNDGVPTGIAKGGQREIEVNRLLAPSTPGASSSRRVRRPASTRGLYLPGAFADYDSDGADLHGQLRRRREEPSLPARARPAGSGS